MKLSERFIRIVKHGNIPLRDSVPEDSLKASNNLFTSFGVEEWSDLAYFSPEDVHDHFKSFPVKVITLRDIRAMGFLFGYAKLTPVSRELRICMAEVISTVEKAEGSSKVSFSIGSCRNSPDCLRKTVPELEHRKNVTS